MKGTYIFFARLDSPADIGVNKKGTICRFDKGWYAYVGSAFNAGGLKSRLNRHYYGTGKKHWHIDFFRKSVTPYSRAWVSCEARKLESVWAAVFQSMAGVSTPVIGFGNSDKTGGALPGGAASHLFFSGLKPRIDEFRQLLAERLPTNQPVCEIRLPLRCSAK